MGLIKIKRAERLISDIKFNIYKFNTKLRPDDPTKTLIVCCFSEFGCEIVGAMYCLPRIVKDNPSAYIIAVGWYGRSYLYQHLVDEYWEVQEDYQYLRDKALAFHNSSKNIANIEKSLSKYGFVVTSEKLGRLAVGNNCRKCRTVWPYNQTLERCPKCASLDIEKAFFADVNYWRAKATPIPKPSREKVELAEQILQRKGRERIVGVVARNRTTYGRNLPASFYNKLIDLLEKLNYKPFWLGEKQSTLECPSKSIIDFSRMPESRDLELTLAIVSRLEFTIQFWTASTRLSAIVETPFIIFESPSQIYEGQEGFRMALTTFGKKKLVLCNFLNVYNNQDGAIDLTNSAISQIENGNWDDVIGMVDEPAVVHNMRIANLNKVGNI